MVRLVLGRTATTKPNKTGTNQEVGLGYVGSKGVLFKLSSQT